MLARKNRQCRRTQNPLSGNGIWEACNSKSLCEKKNMHELKQLWTSIAPISCVSWARGNIDIVLEHFWNTPALPCGLIGWNGISVFATRWSSSPSLYTIQPQSPSKALPRCSTFRHTVHWMTRKASPPSILVKTRIGQGAALKRVSMLFTVEFDDHSSHSEFFQCRVWTHDHVGHRVARSAFAAEKESEAKS